MLQDSKAAQEIAAEGRALMKVRLATWIWPDVSRRLRMLATAEGKRLNAVLNEILDEALPSCDDLARRLSEPSELPLGAETAPVAEEALTA
jgi:hypothetical protein